MGTKQSGVLLTEEEVMQKLEQTLVKAFHNVVRMAETRGVNMRLAAYMVGVRKMAEAVRYRGWV